MSNASITLGKLAKAKPASKPPEADGYAAGYAEAFAAFEDAKAAIAENEARYKIIDRRVMDEVRANDAATEAFEAAKEKAALLLARGEEDNTLVKNARAALVEAEDRLATARAARAALAAELPDLRMTLTVTNLAYTDALRAYVANSPSVAKLLKRYEDMVRETTIMDLALAYIGGKGMMPVKSWGIPPRDDPEVSVLADKWRSAIEALEKDPDAPLPE
jgi:hypothetical protein